jgi:tRNA pseudouridine55 synthase
VRRELSPALAEALHRSDGAAETMLRAAFELERGRTAQVPPAYSAIHSNGERAFARARRGEAVTLAARDVKVHRLDLVGWSATPPTLHVVLDVAKGYYVRSLARDLAEAVDSVGHIGRLRRTRTGSFTIDEATLLDTPPDGIRAHLQPLAAAAARALPTATLTDAGVRDARHGRPLQPHDHDGHPSDACAWLDAQGTLVAIGRVDETRRGTVVRGFRFP